MRSRLNRLAGHRLPVEMARIGSLIKKQKTADEKDGSPRTSSHACRRSLDTISEEEVSIGSQNAWRYSVGLTPQPSRKTWAKCCWVLKPQAIATSNIRVLGARNIVL